MLDPLNSTTNSNCIQIIRSQFELHTKQQKTSFHLKIGAMQTRYQEYWVQNTIHGLKFIVFNKIFRPENSFRYWKNIWCLISRQNANAPLHCARSHEALIRDSPWSTEFQPNALTSEKERQRCNECQCLISVWCIRYIGKCK